MPDANATASADAPPHVVVLGGGFAGLNFCQSLAGRARVTLVDKQNHHLFQPLLYQVATAGLSAPEIAAPIRHVLHDRPNVTVLMDEVTGIDLDARRVHLSRSGLSYDYLVIALGGVTWYFGHDDWATHALGLKTIDDAMAIRHQLLLAFERAETTDDEAERRRLMTVVVVGGGATGVELAGACAELTRVVFKDDFRRIDTSQARIVLVEAGPRVLSMYPPELSEKARRQLEELGVQVLTATPVERIEAGRVLAKGRTIEAETILWGGGVVAVPLTRTLGVPVDRVGRIEVEPDLSLPGHPEAFAVGDLAMIADDNGRPIPGIAPAAIQMGRHVARLIDRELERGPRSPVHRPAFRYRDRGIMATIGRSRGVAWIYNKLRLSGFVAWLAWLGVHLVFLIGFRNKLAVLLQWFYAYVTFRRGARIIFGGKPRTAPPAEPPAPCPAEAASPTSGR